MKTIEFNYDTLFSGPDPKIAELEVLMREIGSTVGITDAVLSSVATALLWIQVCKNEHQRYILMYEEVLKLLKYQTQKIPHATLRRWEREYDTIPNESTLKKSIKDHTHMLRRLAIIEAEAERNNLVPFLNFAVQKCNEEIDRHQEVRRMRAITDVEDTLHNINATINFWSGVQRLLIQERTIAQSEAAIEV